MKLFRKLTSGAMAGVIALSAAAVSAPLSSVTAAGDAVALVEEMGMGWNLGNSFDSGACASWVSTDPYVDTESGWGNPKTTKAMIDNIAAAGFDTIRIPITWTENMDSSGKVNTAYLARIKEVVDWCISDKLHVIINVHHDGASTNDANSATVNATRSTVNGAWLWQGTSQKEKFTGLWKQIAEYFKDYDNSLAFAGWNEICWDYTVEKEMGQAFIDTVRAAGGNNANRLLIVPANNTNLEAALSSDFQLPTDKANMMAVEIHYYSPAPFSIAEQGTSWGYESKWGSDAEINTMKNDINNLSKTFASKGIPVIIGESGVLTEEGKDKASIRSWIQTLFSTALGYDGICPVLWDTSNAGDMNYFDRTNLKWYDTELESIFKNMTGSATDAVMSYTYDNLNEKFTATTEGGWLHYDGGFTIDIKQFKDIAKITGVLVSYTPNYEADAKDPCFGLTLAANGYLTDEEPFDNKSEYKWMNQQVTVPCKDNAITILFNDGMNYTENDTDYGPFTNEGTDWHLSYDYLQFQSWWGNNSGDFTIDSVTVLFESPVVIGTGEVTTTAPIQTTTVSETTTTTTVSSETSAPVVKLLRGDVDENSKVDVADAVLLARAAGGDPDVANLISPNGKLAGDVDNDGSLGQGDLTKVLQYLAHLIPSL